MGDYSSCNGDTFVYQGATPILFLILGLDIAMVLYLLYKMCVLCSTAFSYSHFHIHETYKLYALALLALFMLGMSRKTQLDLKKSEQFPIYVQQGYLLLNEVMGVVSTFTTNILFIHNAFTWLMISLGCDSRISDTVTNFRSSLTEEHTDKNYRSNPTRKRINWASYGVMWVCLPLMMILSLVGTLKQQDGWCSVSLGCTIASSLFALILFTASLSIFLYKRFRDPQIKRSVKILLLYLIVAMLARQIYLVINDISKSSVFVNQYVSLCYVILCTLVPILAMSYLAQIQLQNQKCVILKNSEVLLFGSSAK